ncbi:MAG: hypothetical protein MJE77_21830 [Proteobacteria bacterium]|nr:hypothetical protein [Pseudomonadota bacterium]
MGYRIVEIDEHPARSLDGAVEIAEYDSAYKAVQVMKQARERAAGGRPPRWYLVDRDGLILARPEDLDDLAIAS